MPSPLTYKPATLTFTRPNGREVDARKVVDDNVDYTKERIRQAVADLQPMARRRVDGSISQEQWAQELRKFGDVVAADLKANRVASVVAGVGGVERMKPADFGRAGGLLRSDYDALNDMLVDVLLDPAIATGEATGRMSLERRAAMFADGGVMAFELTHLDEAERAGYTHIINVLEPGKNCTGEGSCVQMTDLSPLPLRSPQWIVQGRRLCKGGCRCRKVLEKREAA